MPPSKAIARRLDSGSTDFKQVDVAGLNSTSSVAPNRSKASMLAKVEAHHGEYSKRLHPGTFACPKRGCLKPFLSSDDVFSLSRNQKSPTSSVFAYPSLNQTWHNSTSLKDLCLIEKSTTVREQSSGCPSKAKKCVSFDIINVREYERQPGDNPSVSRGAPVALGWNVVKEDLFPLDEYENQLGVTRERREKEQLHLSHVEREELLVGWGYSLKEIMGASQQSVKDKNQRMKTLSRASNRSLFFVESTIELTRRRLKRLFRSTEKDFQELLTLTEARNASVLEQAQQLSENQRSRTDTSASVLTAPTDDAVVLLDED